MRIENSPFQEARLLERSTEAVSVPSGELGSSHGSDRVQLSLLSQTLTDASAETGRTAQLRAEVQSGKYQVDPQAVSKKIVDYYLG